MKFTLKRVALAIAGAGLLTIYGCGGGGGGTATTDVPVTVVDGAIENATVCLDKNNNGACDSGEPSGKTDASGKVTLKVDPADAGKYPILAEVGIDAKDFDTGPVMTAFTLKAPADKSAVVSPLTTLVQTIIEGSGLSSAAAETQVKTETGINFSLFDDFTKANTADSKAAGTIARLVVITTQQQITALVGTVGTAALDGSKITKQNLDKAIQKRLTERLAKLKTAAADPAVAAATTPAAKEAALLAQATTLVADSGLSAESVPTVVAVNNQAVAPGADAPTALAQAKAFLALFDASLATSFPGTGVSRAAFSDGCYLDDGFTKPVSIALFDKDRVLSGQENKFRIGSTRTNVQVVADRASTNPDGTKRREIDIKYDVNYVDGTKFSDPNPAIVTTLISGSSSGSVMASGAVCTTPESASNLRFYGNRAVVNAVVRPVNQRYERYSLATGAPLASAVDYNKLVQIRITDPSNFAKYVIVKGLGLPISGYKMLSVRILRDDPLLAGKNNNFVDWLDTDSFRICRNSTNGGFGRAADLADCVGFGAQSNNTGAFNLAPAAADASFDAMGFVAGGAYSLAVYNDDGWKTVNGHVGRTPIAVYTDVLEKLPYRFVDLAGATPAGDKFPHLSFGGQTPVQVRNNLVNAAPAPLAASWTALGALPDAPTFRLFELWEYFQGAKPGNPGSALYPAYRFISFQYPGSNASSIGVWPVSAKPATISSKTYGEFMIYQTDRNARQIESRVSFN